MVKDKRKYSKAKEHIGISDVSLISFGDNVFKRINDEKEEVLNDISDNNEEKK